MSKPFIETSAIVGPGARIGPGTCIGAGCRIDGDASIGARVVVGESAVLGAASIGDDCVIGRGAHVGTGSVLMPRLSVGGHAQIRAGTVLSRNVPPNAIVAGDPGAIVGFSTTQPVRRAADLFEEVGASDGLAVASCAVAGVGLYRFPVMRDARGALSAGEYEKRMPFTPRRWFLVYDVPEGEARGGHTHEFCAEFLICAKGSMSVVLDDAVSRQEIVLDAPHLGLYLPPLVWATQYKHSRDAVLLVFASHRYEAKGYVRDYGDFLARRR